MFTVMPVGMFTAGIVDGSINGVTTTLPLTSRLPPRTPCCWRVAIVPKLVGSVRSKLVIARGPIMGWVLALIGPMLPEDDDTATLGLLIRVLDAWVMFPGPPAAMMTAD